MGIYLGMIKFKIENLIYVKFRYIMTHILFKKTPKTIQNIFNRSLIGGFTIKIV